MPLAWTHAEYIKLALHASSDVRSIVRSPCGGVTAESGQRSRTSSGATTPALLSFRRRLAHAGVARAGSIPLGLRWVADVREQSTTPNPLGLHVLAIDTPRLYVGRWLDFTFRFERGGQWIGRDFRIDVIPRKELAGRPQD